ncbi:CpaF family protein [Zhihengliuella salsuginis]|uniref:Type II secretion system protein E n=1 Tax=Zhihengliuella salsuginis TaxID=578222 RepID=A0ABQ3GFI1_9MICC|nr:CpaF family protein [Zhihengliuella salsuginis]GHD04498.1 type II secretion system protein E [Zhihengliuella salsuginis]
MRLSDRLKANRGNGGGGAPAAAPAHPAPPEPTGDPAVAGADTAPREADAPTAGSAHTPEPAVGVPEPARNREPAERTTGSRNRDALAGLKARAADTLFQRLGSRISDPNMTEDALRRLARDELSRAIDAEQVPLTPEERLRLIRDIGDEVLGLGPLQRLLDDDSVTEIMVNDHRQIFVERHGRLAEVDAGFSTDEHLRRVIERIVSRVGRRIDESSPLVDARLEDGSRVNAIIPPLAVNGPSLTIRKFGAVPLTVRNLTDYGTLTPEMAHLLRACVEARLNIVISGGTGTGKTTLLNVLSSFIPNDERIITIEDAVELQLQQDHVVRLESRPANIEGSGAVTIRDLVRNSLRMRPDRIIVGEVRGGETLDMLQAMNTGHDGSISTVHANAPRDAIARLETLVLMAGMDLPLRAIREQISSAVDLIVHLTRLRDGTRRVTHVTEVQGMEGDIITLQDAFAFDYAAGVDAHGRFLGRPVPTGVRPRFVDHFHDVGVSLPAGLFDGGPR